MMTLHQLPMLRRMMTDKPSPTAVFELECKQRSCIKCGKKGTLIPKEPRNYHKMRCTNCGCFLTLMKED